MSDSCFMGPILRTSAISTHRGSTEASVGLMVSVYIVDRLIFFLQFSFSYSLAEFLAVKDR